MIFSQVLQRYLTKDEEDVVKSTREAIQPKVEYIAIEVDIPNYRMVSFYNKKIPTERRIIVDVIA